MGKSVRWIGAVLVALAIGWAARETWARATGCSLFPMTLASSVVEASVFVALARPRRGWQAGLALVATKTLVVHALLIAVGFPASGSATGAVHLWWANIGCVGRVELVAVLPCGMLGGHLGTLLVRHVATRPAS